MNNKIYNYGIGLFRIIALVVVSVITLAGIADAQVTGQTKQPIAVINIRLWTENNYVVPVCWETPGYDREKAIVQRAVSNTWERHSNLSFTWKMCYSPTTNIQLMGVSTAMVRIRISPQGKDEDSNYKNA